MRIVAKARVDAVSRVARARAQPKYIREPVEKAQHVLLDVFARPDQTHDIAFRTPADGSRNFEMRAAWVSAWYRPIARQPRRRLKILHEPIEHRKHLIGNDRHLFARAGLGRNRRPKREHQPLNSQNDCGQLDVVAKSARYAENAVELVDAS